MGGLLSVGAWHRGDPLGVLSAQVSQGAFTAMGAKPQLLCFADTAPGASDSPGHGSSLAFQSPASTWAFYVSPPIPQGSP